MPSSNGWSRLENAQVARPDEVAVAGVEVPPFAVDAAPPGAVHHRAQQLAVADLRRGELAAQDERGFQPRMGSLREVVELRAHVELAAGRADERHVHRPAEGADRAAPRGAA